MKYFERRRATEVKSITRAIPERDKPPSMDFALIPLAETIKLLRSIGSQLVVDLLVREGVSKRRAPDLIDLIMSAPSFETLQSRLYADPRSSLSVGVFDRFPTSTIGQSPSSRDFPVLVGKLINSEFQIDQYNLMVRQQVLTRLGVSRYHFVPDMFWHLAGVLAWMDLNLQYDTAYAARKFLLSRTLFLPNDSTEPTFSPRVFWALIAQTNGGSQQIQTRPANVSIWLNDAARSLSGVAVRMALLPGQVGVWDRWLAAQSFDVWLSGSEENSRELQKILPKVQKLSELFAPQN